MKKGLEILNIISKCQKEFEVNLKNKEIMFICEDKTRKIEIEEVIFPKSCFYHLTGITAFDKSGQELNSYRFYDLLSNGRINENNINRKNNTTDLKLQVLPQLMKIDRISNMMGEFESNNLYLQTQKVAGTIKRKIFKIKYAIDYKKQKLFCLFMFCVIRYKKKTKELKNDSRSNYKYKRKIFK